MPNNTAKRCRIAIFASGSGSNAEEIIKATRASNWGEVILTLTNNPRAGVLDRTKRLQTPSQVLSKDQINDGAFLLDLLTTGKIQLVVLAGYLKKIPQNVVQKFEGKIINIHPSLLPEYGGKGMYGMKVHEAVIRNGDHYSGITIHHVTEEYDEGAPILQEKVKIEPDWTPEILATKIHQLEHRHFPEVVEFMCRNIQKALS